eukprot:TRINITY_DN14366_c0_g1_i1.p2 TRINITY_DN14366_c0_g1~~TRINITY_DN14366_c0_g1_i1.p2  ORF type:complete len:206 (+),score=30.68 TRINITY_DN14366_c0_g1_i1:147-764(+)
MVSYFGSKYYGDRFSGVLPDAERLELQQLAAAARQQPVLALAAAQALYMFGWYTGAAPEGRAVEDTSSVPAAARSLVDWDNVALAAEFFEASLEYGDCANESLTEWEFTEGRSCDMRWSHALVLHAYLAIACRSALGDDSRASEYETRAGPAADASFFWLMLLTLDGPFAIQLQRLVFPKRSFCIVVVFEPKSGQAAAIACRVSC